MLENMRVTLIAVCGVVIIVAIAVCFIKMMINTTKNHLK